MATEVFNATVTGDELAETMQRGYEALREATGPAYDDITTFEYFASELTVDRGRAEVYKAYGHRGLNVYVATVKEIS